MESKDGIYEDLDETAAVESVVEIEDLVAEEMELEEHPSISNEIKDASIEEQKQGIEGEGVEDTPGGDEELDDEDTITFSFKRTHFYAVIIPITFIIGLSVGYLFWGRTPAAAPVVVAEADSAVNPTASNSQGASQQDQGTSGTTVNVPEQVVRYDVPDDGDPSIGPDDAQITIIEFSDYECPYCRKFRIETFDRLLAAYPDQVRFVYRDFPLDNIHPEATPAAIAANCALEQDAYWEYHDQLFGGTQGLGDAAYQQYAANLGLNLDQFNLCLASEQAAAEVKADFQYAASLGIQSTPTFFINGIPLLGAQPFEVFQQIIDLELAGEIPE